MAYGQPDFITTHLLTDARKQAIEEHLPGGLVLDRRAIKARSSSRLYGSTAGPWGGVGGAAMTRFQHTTLRQGDLLLAFVDERPYGYRAADGVHPCEDPEDFNADDWVRFPASLR